MPYAITEGLPGLYMPDNCCHVWTKKDAEAIAAESARIYREDWDGNYRVEGSARSGRYDIHDDDRGMGSHIACIEIHEMDLQDFAPDCVCGRETEPTDDGPCCPRCGLDVR